MFKFSSPSYDNYLQHGSPIFQNLDAIIKFKLSRHGFLS